MTAIFTSEKQVLSDAERFRFPADKNGRYDLRVRVRAAAKPVGK